MTTKEMVRSWLESHGYDGLINEETGCTCSLLFDIEGKCEGALSHQCVQAVYDRPESYLVAAVDPWDMPKARR